MNTQARSGIHQLEATLRRLPGERVSIGTIVDALGRDTWGLCFFLFAAAALVPGIAPIFGVALCIVAASMVLGRERPFLPDRVRRWQTDRDDLMHGLIRLKPALAWIERRLRRRGAVFLSEPALRLSGFAALVNAVLVVLPVPFGNTAPAVATIVLSLGLTARDGFAVLAGMGLTFVAVLLDLALLWTGYEAVSAAFDWLFFQSGRQTQ